MSARGVWIVGAGARVKDAFLPVLRALEPRLELRALLARSARTLHAGGRVVPVRHLSSFVQGDLEDGDLVVVAVSKASVPEVLTRLTELDVARVDLLIDTPVVRFKLFHHWRKTQRFRSASVAEDCAVLPWIDTVRALLDSGAIGDLREVRLEHAAYAYHGVATGKALTGRRRVRAGRRVRGEVEFVRTLRFAGGARVVVTEPCRYDDGWLRVTGSTGVLSDRDEDGTLRLEPLVSSGRVEGFRAGDVRTHLAAEESALTEGDAPGATVIARQAAMKRVGLYRLLSRVAAGEAGYSVRDGLDDMVVDYHLEKFGRYVANPLTSCDSPLARLAFGAVTRLGGA